MSTTLLPNSLYRHRIVANQQLAILGFQHLSRRVRIISHDVDTGRTCARFIFKSAKHPILFHFNSPVPTILLSSNHVGLVPLADIEVNVVSRIEIIGHSVRLIIPVSRLKCLESLSQEVLSNTIEVLLKPVGVNVNRLILANVRNLIFRKVFSVGLFGIGLNVVFDEINLT